MLSVAILLLYVVVSTAGLIRIKSSAAILSVEFVTGLVLYGAGFVIWVILLRRMQLSTAFPVAASSLIVATMLSGRFLLGESVELIHWFGCVIILIGIALVSWRGVPV